MAYLLHWIESFPPSFDLTVIKKSPTLLEDAPLKKTHIEESFSPGKPPKDPIYPTKSMLIGFASEILLPITTQSMEDSMNFTWYKKLHPELGSSSERIFKISSSPRG